jgi:hypothetical protein
MKIRLKAAVNNQIYFGREFTYEDRIGIYCAYHKIPSYSFQIWTHEDGGTKTAKIILHRNISIEHFFTPIKNLYTDLELARSKLEIKEKRKEESDKILEMIRKNLRSLK